VEIGEQQLTERLLVRAPEASDRAGYLDLFLDPAVGRWLGPAPIELLDEDEVLAMLSANRRHWDEYGFGPWVLVERARKRMVGRGGLCWTELDGGRAVELAWAIGSDCWGQGLATEAASAAIEWAKSLALDEVVALIVPDNVASRRVAEKVGLELDGETLHAGLLHLVYRLSLQ
jgi:ribosomal-protein-alanine N-acetyltransferase